MSKRRRTAVAVVVVAVVGVVSALALSYATEVGDGAIRRAVGKMDDVLDPGSEEPTPTTTVPPRPVYEEPTPRPDVAESEAGVRFFCDFVEACALDQFVQYRDGWVVEVVSGEADHAPAEGATFEDPVCMAPETTRPWHRAEPYKLTYRCLPGGDPELAHQMSVVPDTSGYTFTASSPNVVFENVDRISFEVNMTSAGNRNFWEVAVIPAEQSWVDAMPCIPDLPCNDGYDYSDIGAVGVGNHGTAGSGFDIATPDRPDGYGYDASSATAVVGTGVVFGLCPGGPDDFCFEATIHDAQPDVRRRFDVVIEDRNDGLWFGQEGLDGEMYWVTAPSDHFPSGPVRVVLKFHGYTPTKDGNGPGYDGNLSASVGGFTWHWDNFEVVAGGSVASADYYGGINPERFVTSSIPECVAFAQGQRDESNRTVWPLISCPPGIDTGDAPTVVHGQVDAALVIH